MTGLAFSPAEMRFSAEKKPITKHSAFGVIKYPLNISVNLSFKCLLWPHSNFVFLTRNKLILSWPSIVIYRTDITRGYAFCMVFHVRFFS